MDHARCPQNWQTATGRSEKAQDIFLRRAGQVVRMLVFHCSRRPHIGAIGDSRFSPTVGHRVDCRYRGMLTWQGVFWSRCFHP